MIRRNTILALAPLALLPAASTVAAAERPLVVHVKTALSVADAQICVVPHVAWAALAEGRPVVFDGSAVTSVARGYGWRGWLGINSTPWSGLGSRSASAARSPSRLTTRRSRWNCSPSCRF
jgi:hypothetical protein